MNSGIGKPKIFDFLSCAGWLIEIDPAGYSTPRVTDGSGSDAANASVRDEVHAVGGQLKFDSHAVEREL